jgi:hypothetical protein
MKKNLRDSLDSSSLMAVVFVGRSRSTSPLTANVGRDVYESGKVVIDMYIEEGYCRWPAKQFPTVAKAIAAAKRELKFYTGRTPRVHSYEKTIAALDAHFAKLTKEATVARKRRAPKRGCRYGR